VDIRIVFLHVKIYHILPNHPLQISVFNLASDIIIPMETRKVFVIFLCIYTKSLLFFFVFIQRFSHFSLYFLKVFVIFLCIYL